MKKILCRNCHKHRASVNWIGEGSTLDYIHGFYQSWCRCCCIKAQIKYAEERVNDLISLKNKLRNVNCS